MNFLPDRLAWAWAGAVQHLAQATPKGWRAERNGTGAVVTRAAVASLNAAYSVDQEPDLEALDEMARAVSVLGVPWSIIVRAGAAQAAAGLAATYGLTARAKMPLMTCSAATAVLTADVFPIRPVGSDRSDAYTEALTAGFQAPAGTFGSLMGGGVLDQPGWTGYLAEIDGRPVATGLGVCGPDVIGVFNVAVDPSVRGRGLGRAMTARILADGFATGAAEAYLHPSTAARPLYESMGFRVIETWTEFTAL
ncbi:GNAT family N-acetyltransferase [Paractinoplanes atraurantiacus]|uniref:Acetyltransferase (GNAT) domain-containing protein n=1 Tax=Paractinoplanes atraurantiacus TaxID=1036182 RepID=A0A285GU95_9ACTN|nr:GNAT family N-acetyltransferase [Actinoplanes atraurantiacus]SNY26086.1 Acetyltransferase (GNAT) domain-containing protein [Actinoplanes atraurantiacus]